MINGAHVVIYSKDAERDRALLRDVLGFRHVDAGHGWLIFALPDSEAAVHPSDENDRHELYLMCDDVEAEVRRLNTLGVACDPIDTVGWGRLTHLRLPGGGTLGLYQPRHERP
jgi:catechol 2,3-dioxygenase-like lactoylglutathione lyase family enzyme